MHGLLLRYYLSTPLCFSQTFSASSRTHASFFQTNWVQTTWECFYKKIKKDVIAVIIMNLGCTPSEVSHSHLCFRWHFFRFIVTVLVEHRCDCHLRFGHTGLFLRAHLHLYAHVLQTILCTQSHIVQLLLLPFG